MFSNPMRKVKDSIRSLTARFNRKATIAAPKPTPPQKTMTTVEFKPTEEVDELTYRDRRTTAKMKRTHDKRHAMKKFHKRQARLNKQYRVKS
jgi:hypothetical protein